MLPVLLLLVSPFYTTVRVNAAQILAVGVNVMLPVLLLLVPPLYTTVGVNAAQILAVGVGVMLPLLLLLARLLHYGEGQCCPNFRRWCRRCAADFTAVGAALYTTVRLNAQISAVGVGVMLPILLLLEPPLLYGEVKCCPFYCCRCRLFRLRLG